MSRCPDNGRELQAAIESLAQQQDLSPLARLLIQQAARLQAMPRPADRRHALRAFADAIILSETIHTPTP